MRISVEDWAMDVDARRGGSLTALTWKGDEILRTTPAESAEPLDLSMFPLVPYANRIGGGEFNWNGASYRLAPNHSAQFHPLHGIGWLREWSVTSSDQNSVRIEFRHEGDGDWPWAFIARQEFSLSSHGLDASLSIENLSEEAVPVGLGFHPYFVRRGVERLAFSARQVWLTSEDLLPRERVEAEQLGNWSTGQHLERETLIDHCFVDWSQSARLFRTRGDILIEADGLSAFHFYLPPGETFFCCEPVSTIPNAVNMGTAEPLAPAATKTVSMRIRSA